MAIRHTTVMKYSYWHDQKTKVKNRANLYKKIFFFLVPFILLKQLINPQRACM